MVETDVHPDESGRTAARSQIAERAGGYADQEKYRLAIVASSAEAVVRMAGGLLFDRVMAGWEIAAMVPGTDDSRPLAILGVEVFDLDSALEWHTHHDLCPQALAVSADLYDRDDRVRTGVHETLDLGGTEVLFLGTPALDGLSHPMSAVEHRLTWAARAFKKHALAATEAATDDIDAVEQFTTSAPLAFAIGGTARTGD